MAEKLDKFTPPVDLVDLDNASGKATQFGFSELSAAKERLNAGKGLAGDLPTALLGFLEGEKPKGVWGRLFGRSRRLRLDEAKRKEFAGQAFRLLGSVNEADADDALKAQALERLTERKLAEFAGKYPGDEELPLPKRRSGPEAWRIAHPGEGEDQYKK